MPPKASISKRPALVCNGLRQGTSLKQRPTLPHLRLGKKSEPACSISGIAVIFSVHWDHPPAAESIKIHNADGW
ncbi:hypothetical protein SVAN01_08572 [Stagonosporopsis vannaccii]|nr:hypothetical protein SVAN01_08572 [Stagonosporopsis vannaccii]